MFDPDPLQLLAEIEEAEKVRDDHLFGVNRIIREYTGRWYRGAREMDGPRGELDSQANPEPFSYSFISNILPQLVYTNPAIAVQARRVIGHRMVQEAMESGLTSWINDINYKKELEKVVEDMLFFQGILMHYIEDDTRWADGAVRPNVMRIDFRNWGCDSLADSRDRTEFDFHSYWIDIDDLTQDPALLPEAMEKLKPGDRGADELKQPWKKGDAYTLARKQVKVYSVWLRRANKIRVICKDPKGTELYDPRPYYGPYCGPYEVFQAYPVPGQVYPLSPLVAVQDQVLDTQLHARALARSAAGRKSVIITDGTVGGLADDITNCNDREVLAVPGFNSSQVVQLELGGATNQQYQHQEYIKARLDEHSGLTQIQRGQTGGSDSATEAQIATEALNSRLEYLKNRVSDAMNSSLKSVGWFLFHTPGVIIPVSRRDPLTGQEQEGLFFGGHVEGVDAGSWEDYSLKVESFSMPKVSEQMLQRRALDFANYLSQTAPLAPQLPFLRWMDIWRMVGKAMGCSKTADDLVIPEMLMMFSQPDMLPIGQVLGQEQQTDRYSIPGQGFKPKPGEPGMNPNSNAPMIDPRRAAMGADAGDIGGGQQGPPGSAATGALVTKAY